MIMVDQTRNPILNRLGIMDIPRELMESAPELLMEHVFSKMVVLACFFKNGCVQV